MHEGEFSKGIHKWEGIRSIEQSKRQIFLFTDRNMAYIIPKRYFENNEKLEAFILEIENKIQESGI